MMKNNSNIKKSKIRILTIEELYMINGRRNKLKAKIRKQAITMTDKKIQYMRMKKV